MNLLLNCLPCPKCGSDQVERVLKNVYEHESYGYDIECLTCETQFKHYNMFKENWTPRAGKMIDGRRYSVSVMNYNLYVLTDYNQMNFEDALEIICL